MGKHGLSIAERLELGTRKDEGGCWQWTQYVHKNGYGQLWVETQNEWVHRLAYELNVGPIPKGWDVGHKCHDTAAMAGLCEDGIACLHRSCLNPEHLKAELRTSNLHASPHTQATINSSKTHCKRGHEFTSENTLVRKRGWRSCRTCARMGKVGRDEWDKVNT